MAHSTLPAFSSSLFPQLIQGLVGREIQRVDQVLAKSELSACSYESPESFTGACDGGFPCYELGTVTDLETGCGYCLRHFTSEVALV